MISTNANIQTTWINGLTNDYQVTNGIIQKNNNLLTEAYTRIVTPLGSYFFDTTFGSQIPIWLNQRLLLNSDTAVGELLRCTQPMVNQGRAQTITAKLTAPVTITAIFFSMTIVDNTGVSVRLDSNYVSIPSQVFPG